MDNYSTVEHSQHAFTDFMKPIEVVNSSQEGSALVKDMPRLHPETIFRFPFAAVHIAFKSQAKAIAFLVVNAKTTGVTEEMAAAYLQKAFNEFNKGRRRV